jgi:methionyl-tRNA formyltransferase
MTKVVFFGNERLVSGLEKTDASILNGLIANNYEVVAIVSNYSDSKSRNQRELEVADVARENDIPLFIPNKPSEIIEDLRKLGAEIAVLAAYGRMVSQSVIDIFPKGIVNIHPSLLPLYRGPTPIESAILNGDTNTGVSIMLLSAGMDTGPVYAQQSIDLNGDETKFELYEKIINISTPLFFEVFPQIIDQSLHPQPQDDNAATYSKLIQKSDGIIDWSKEAEQLEREVRAYLGWPQSRTTLSGIEVILTKSTVRETGPATPGNIMVEKDRLFVGTGKDWLEIHKLKPLGKKEMPVSAFLAGYQSRITN